MDFADLQAQLSAQPALALLVVFAAGVLTSFTPCIYPMIPITASLIGGQTIGTTVRRPKLRALGLSLAYAIGLATVYAALGLFAGLTGSLFGSVSTNPWLYFGMANLLILAGLECWTSFLYACHPGWFSALQRWVLVAASPAPSPWARPQDW